MNKLKNNYKVITLFLFPGLAVYLFLVLYPIVQAFYLSTFRWNTLENKTFIGFENYIDLFQNRHFWSSLKNSFIFMAGSTVLYVLIGFSLGYLLYKQLRGYKFFKSAYFVPVVLSTVAVGFIWSYILSPSIGLYKPMMLSLGLAKQYKPPLATPSIALLFVIFTYTWHAAGRSIMLFNAGFMNIPQDVIESASIDGASGWKMIYHMIIPLAWEISKTVTILQIIGSLRSFDLIFVMTRGGPTRATEVLPLHMFVEAFENFQLGRGNAIAVVIFVVCFGMTLLFKRLMKREALQY